MAKETDTNAVVETDPVLSPRTSSEMKAANYIELRNANRVEQEIGIDDGIKRLEKRLAIPMSRSTMESVAGSGQSISSPFQSILSSQNSDAMSVAAREAMDHLNRVLEGNTRAEERGFMKYIEKVMMVPIHRLSDKEVAPCEIGDQDWALVKLAADMSRSVYKDKIEAAPGVVIHKAFKAGLSMKPALVSTHNYGETKIRVVTIRGTVTTNDWMLNVNGEPKTSDAFEQTSLWHRGFLSMALKMQKNIAEIVKKITPQSDKSDPILFTGHSAGGAIAQILYALSMQSDSALARAVQGFSTVHCVTFAAPPVSRPPIVPDPVRNPRHAKGRFFAIINEGDPVPLAQREYIFALLEVYAKTIDTLEAENLQKFEVPKPVMQLSGQCILLRDENPKRWQEFRIGAYDVSADVLQSKLFGNPLEHFMMEYQSRLYRALGLELPVENGEEIDL